MSWNGNRINFGPLSVLATEDVAWLISISVGFSWEGTPTFKSSLTVKQCLVAIISNEDQSLQRWNDGAGHPTGISTLKKALESYWVHCCWSVDLESLFGDDSTTLNFTDPQTPRPRLCHEIQAAWRASMFQ